MTTPTTKAALTYRSRVLLWLLRQSRLDKGGGPAFVSIDLIEEELPRIEAEARAQADGDDLGTAWREVEALIPSGHRLDLTFGYATKEHPDWCYHATCRAKGDYLGYIGHNPGGPTPVAALNALRDALAAMRETLEGGR